MPSARYWRLTGCAPYDSTSDLSISDLALLNGSTRVDTGPTCTYAPIEGSTANLGDNTAGTFARYSRSDLHKTNFAFNWDLGAEVNVDSLRVGSVASKATFLATAALEASTDGTRWFSISRIRGVVYPGVSAQALISKFKITTPDALCRFDGSNGSKVVTNDFGAMPSFNFGNAPNVSLSTAQKYAGTASMSFPGGEALFTGSIATSEPLPGRFNSSFFTMSAWVYPTALGGYVAGCWDSASSTQTEGWFLRTLTTGGLRGSVAIFGQESFILNSATGIVVLNTWQHVALERQGTVARLYLNGQVVAERTDLPQTPIGTSFSRGLAIGSLNLNLTNTPFTGFIDELTLTNNFALYVGLPFVPDAWEEQTGDSPSAYALDAAASSHAFNSDIVLFTPQSINTQPRDTLPSESRIDMIFGGRGVIAGTVKEKSLPENTPLFRKVRLIDERSGYVVAETWSDATTGNYSFANIDRSRTYAVVSYDHTGLDRAVIADRLTPELMS